MVSPYVGAPVQTWLTMKVSMVPCAEEAVLAPRDIRQAGPTDVPCVSARGGTKRTVSFPQDGGLATWLLTIA